jgi:hypothetical protein
MERLTIKLTIFYMDIIQIYLMSDRSGEQNVILTTIWLWQRSRDWQYVISAQISNGEAQSQEIK